MSTARERFPALKQLCGAYLHQDADIVHGGHDEAVDAFALEDSRASLLRGEVDGILASGADDAAVATILEDMRADWYDTDHPLRWLTTVAARVEATRSGLDAQG